MGKVFNDQIIKILCAKNLNKTHNAVCEPNLNTKCQSRLQRGESYVVFLDRQHRKELQRQMGFVDANTDNDRSLCSPSIYPVNRIQSWLNGSFKKQRTCTCSNYKILKRHLCESLHEIGEFLGLPKITSKGVVVMRPSARPTGDEELVTPALLGAFVDEPFCLLIDRFYYCLSLILGQVLETVERSEELERTN